MDRDRLNGQMWNEQTEMDRTVPNSLNGLKWTE